VLHKLQSFGVMRAEMRPPGALPMTADAAPATNVSSDAKIFISYSREDIAFADQLEAALKVRGFEPLIDRTDIYAFEDWWARIQSLIGKADTIVFVLSPDAVASDICEKEVAYSASLNKRFAPIVFRPVRGRDVPEAIRRLNYIFFDGPSTFEASADRLAEAYKPISAGSGSIPNWGNSPGAGLLPGATALAACCCAHPPWKKRNIGLLRGRTTRRRPLRRRELSLPRAGAPRYAGATS
jgi:hypothetical protein